MKTIEVPSGVCLGFGGSNARRAECFNGDIKGYTSVQTPERPREFFGWMARAVLTASHLGHGWLVAGFPGPVSADGKAVGPLANVSGMAEKRYDLQQELTAADPAVGRLLDEGFILLADNDGNLAAHAAAARVGEHRYKRTGALILGTGVGFGMVEKNPDYSDVHHTDKGNPLEIGHIPQGADPFDTFETNYSGVALERKYGCDPRDMAANHPAWRELGVGVGRMAATVGLLNNVELMIPVGGVGMGASEKYSPYVDEFMATYREFGNGAQRIFAPTILYADPSEAQVFEMFGAEGVVRDHLAMAG